MYQGTPYEKIEKYTDVLFIDLRSPKEYNLSTIPGAINMPILNDLQREEIGILYTEGNLNESKEKAVTYAANLLPSYFAKIVQYSKEREHVILFCSRGGYRSTVLFNLLRTLHIKVEKLDWGYKGYRQHLIGNLPKILEPLEIISLKGYTGCGKSEILKELEQLGADVLDLESLANHRGSLLGHVGLGGQPSQKQFESLLYDKLLNLKSTLLFIEGESRKIGKVEIPHLLYSKMKKAKIVEIVASLENRVSRIKGEYVQGHDDQILQGIESLGKYISTQRINSFKENILQGNYEPVIEELMVKYYDANYCTKKDCPLLTVENINSKQAAQFLYLKFINKD